MTIFDTPDRDGTVVVADDLLAGAAEEEQHVEEPALPEIVYVPTSELISRTDENVVVELRPLADNRIGLLVYSSIESLVECCGDAQPWMAVPSTQLEQIRLETNADVIGLDVPLPVHLMRDGGA